MPVGRNSHHAFRYSSRKSESCCQERGRGSGRPNSRPNYVGCYNEREVTGNKTCSFQTKRIAVSTFNLAREIGFRLFRKIIVFLFQTNLLDKFIQSHRFNSLDSGNTPPPLETHRKGRDSNHRWDVNQQTNQFSIFTLYFRISIVLYESSHLKKDILHRILSIRGYVVKRFDQK